VPARSTFKPAEIAAVAAWAQKGVRIELVARPDGTRIVRAAADVDVPASSDIDARLDAFGAS
jgi:hypothetical protein